MVPTTIHNTAFAFINPGYLSNPYNMFYFLRIELLFIVLEMQHLHVPSGYGTLNNSPCITKSMLSMSLESREEDENQAFFLAL